MLKKFKSLKANKKGFTLAELLIVVAIIAILAAIAIPVFYSQLNEARLAVDKANLRTAYSLASNDYLMHHHTGTVEYTFGLDAEKNFGINTVTSDDSSVTCSAAIGSFSSEIKPQSTQAAKGNLTVTVKDGKVTANSWGIKLDTTISPQNT